MQSKITSCQALQNKLLLWYPSLWFKQKAQAHTASKCYRINKHIYYRHHLQSVGFLKHSKVLQLHTEEHIQQIYLHHKYQQRLETNLQAIFYTSILWQKPFFQNQFWIIFSPCWSKHYFFIYCCVCKKTLYTMQWFTSRAFIEQNIQRECTRWSHPPKL